MEANTYQNRTQDTAVYPGRHTPSGLNYTILGLVGEAGELANKLKKVYRNQDSVYANREVFVDELGDVLWYAAAFAKELGVSLEEVMEKNLAKLQARKESGTLKNR